MKRSLLAVGLLTVLVSVPAFFITGCLSGVNNNNNEPVPEFFTGPEVISMSAALATADNYPETVGIGDYQISLADSVYLMAQWLALYRSDPNEKSGIVPEYVSYKRISPPKAVTPGKEDGVVVWSDLCDAAEDLAGELSTTGQIPEEITVGWRQLLPTWDEIEAEQSTEQTISVNVLISIFARSIKFAGENGRLPNFARVAGGNLPWSWPVEFFRLTKVIGPGKSWETRLYITKSREAGPTVWIVGGMHGNEPAGYQAAGQVINWRPDRGTLVVLPEANTVGIAKNQRNSAFGDLNRAFPDRPEGAPTNELAEAIWEEVMGYKPDFLLDLHEGVDYARSSSSVGQSFIYFPDYLPAGSKLGEFAAGLTAEFNAERPEEEHFIVINDYNVYGSLALAAALHNAEAVIFETCIKDALAQRVDCHLRVVERFLAYAGVEGRSSYTQ